VFCAVNLIQLEEPLTHSLVFKTKGISSKRLALRCSKVLFDEQALLYVTLTSELAIEELFFY
jgi:hypothetical protein